LNKKYEVRKKDMSANRFSLRSGIVTGRAHLLFGINCQDSLNHTTFIHKDEEYIVGVVCDGCGEGARSEVGAHLASKFLVQRIEQGIKDGLSTEAIISVPLFYWLVEYLRIIVSRMDMWSMTASDKVTFIKDHLLFTAIGFVVGPRKTTIFSIGDGVIQINDDLVVIDEGNMPLYPAYHLVDRQFLAPGHTELPERFEIKVIDTSELQRLAVGTDAWEDELKQLETFWGQGKKFSLQRAMNVLSKKKKRFKDDASLIMIERLVKDSDEEE
jgi:hypothetical protein